MKDVCIGRFMIIYFLLDIMKGYEVINKQLFYNEISEYCEMKNADEFWEVINSEGMIELDKPNDFRMYLRYLDYKNKALDKVMSDEEGLVFIAKKTAVYIVEELTSASDMEMSLESLSGKMESFISEFNKAQCICKDDFAIDKLFEELTRIVYKHMDKHVFDMYSASYIVDKSKEISRRKAKSGTKIGY
ncbi:MAG: hypothetical protein R3Y32_00125 [Bacillota bacterium]